jgi:ribosomal protein S18 acetylase RimI-like enzyme
MVAIVKNSLSRIRRGISRHGLIPSIRRFAISKINRIFRARLCVWAWNYGDQLMDDSNDVLIERYESESQIPVSIRAGLIEGETETFSARMSEEFAEGGVLWVALIDGLVAGYQWSRTGNFVENWHFELNERDVLIYSTVTFHEFQGRGVARKTMAKICREEVGENGRSLADCMVWNTPAVRFIQKVGFTKIAERKPLSGHPD